MPIQIVKDDERLTHKSEGSKIFYRRISTLKRGFIVKKHTKRGKTDWNAVSKEILEYVILGWEKVQLKKKDIPFDSDMIMALPDDELVEILEKSGGSNPENEVDEDLEKNLETSSSGN